MPKYPVPEGLKELIEPDVYHKWLHRKAKSLVKRDRTRGNPDATVESYKEEIQKTLVRDGIADWYTGETLNWNLVSTYDNEESKHDGREVKKKFRLLPTIDHESNGCAPPFRVCGWAVNDAKNDLSLEDFVALCKRVIAHQQ